MVFDPSKLTSLMKNKISYSMNFNNHFLQLNFSRNEAFAVFRNRPYLTRLQELSINPDCTWKAHFSIHHDDLERAWEIIYPLLSTAASEITKPMAFKIVDPQFILKDIHRLQEYLDNNFLIDKAKLRLQDNQRFEKGMQVTLYMLPGTEQGHQPLLEEIEHALINQGIRPGVIHSSDRSIGLYTSVRHTGTNGYIHGTDATSYNPSNLPDPFTLLPTHNYNKQDLFLKFLEVNLTIHINRLRANHMSLFKHNKKLKLEFANFLETERNNFFNLSVDEQIQQLPQFQNTIFSKQEELGKGISNDAEWVSLAKNLILLFTGLGTVFAFASLGLKVLTGDYLFFNDKTQPNEVLGTVDFREDAKTLMPQPNSP